MSTSLFEIIASADAIEIDDHFLRYFNVELDDIENDDDIALEAESTDEQGTWYFTVSDLKQAVYNPETKQWTVHMGKDAEPYMITLYSVKPLSVIG